MPTGPAWVGICVVLAAGLAAMVIAVRVPREAKWSPRHLFGEDGCVPAASRANIEVQLDGSALSARSVLATALLGADQPHLTVGELVAVASLFGITDGAGRHALAGVVQAANGELTSEDGTYALAGACSTGASA